MLKGRTQWPRVPRRGSAASPLLGLRVRISLGHGCLPLVCFVCCQVEVYATGRSLFQRSPTARARAHVCVCVCVCVTECDQLQQYPAHLQCVGRRRSRVKRRNEINVEDNGSERCRFAE